MLLNVNVKQSKERLLKTLNHNTYADYHLIISDIANEGFEYVDIAAAALQLSIEGVKEKEEKVSDERFENTGGAPGMVRLFLNIGRKQGIRPQDIVRTFASEVDIPGSVIGVINIYDKFTFVEVPKDIAEKVISVMHRNTIKGYKLNIEPAKGR